MKTGLVLLLAAAAFCLIFSPLASAQGGGPSLAPPNPEFVRYLEQPAVAQAFTAEGNSLGLIPSPLDLSYMAGQRIFQGPPMVGYPATYDLRTLGKLTPVKNQGACGSCWAFATYGSMESCLLLGETWDFSENHLKNTHGLTLGCCAGGNREMSTAYLARWSGPVTEACDPYTTSCISQPGCPVQKHVQEVVFIPDRAGSLDNDNIKQAITTYGAMYTTYYHTDSSYNSTYKSYYYSGGSGSNHAVCIVGWDDNYDRNRFSTIPAGNGAFIIKNSWGPGWGEAGYFYMSYYDSKVGKANALFRNAESTSNYLRVYEYDPLGWTTSLGYSSTTAWYANIFTATASESLAAISTYAASSNSPYELYIYTDPTTNPRTGALAAAKIGTIVEPGYTTITLDSPVPLSTGHKFSVVIKLTTPGYTYPIPLEYPFAGYSEGATASAGQSYISSNGTAWSDITSSYANTNVCIKVFTGGPTKVAAPAFSVPSGVYALSQSVTITCATPGAAIHYTMGNGPAPPEPTEADPSISSGASLLISSSTTLRAKAFKSGLAASDTTSADYIIGGNTSISSMKGLTDGTLVGCEAAVVSAAFPDFFYIEADDRSSGIRVEEAAHGLLAQKRARVVGRMRTNTNGERYIEPAVAVQNGLGTVDPVGMNNRALGGGPSGLQEGIAGASGLNNIGLLVRTSGRVLQGLQVIQSWSLDTDPGWTLEGLWAHGVPTGGGSGSHDPTLGHTGTNVIGYNLAGDYTNSMPIRYATTPAINCSGCYNVRLRFWRWLGIESSAYDHANIQVSKDGANWTTVWEHASGSFSESAWSHQVYDISSVADNEPTVYLRWGMGPTDSSVTYPGWNLDDVDIIGVPGPCVIDDGSGVGLPVRLPAGTMPPEVGSFVVLTGISSCEKVGPDLGRRLIVVP